MHLKGNFMGKRKKHKIRRLDSCPYTPGIEKRIQLEEDSQKIFEEAIKSTNWAQVAKEKEASEAVKKRKTPKKQMVEKTIDLHGYTVKESKALLTELIHKAISSEAKELKLKIITGKGLRSASEGGGVLAREIPLHIEVKWAKRILFIEDSPAKVLMGGVPLRGDFTVILDVREEN